MKRSTQTYTSYQNITCQYNMNRPWVGLSIVLLHVGFSLPTEQWPSKFEFSRSVSLIPRHSLLVPCYCKFINIICIFKSFIFFSYQKKSFIFFFLQILSLLVISCVGLCVGTPVLACSNFGSRYSSILLLIHIAVFSLICRAKWQEIL